MTKSVVATLAGILIHRVELVPAAAVTAYLPELAGTSWNGATVQQLLDMSTGTAFDESDYEDPESESARGFRVMGWSERRPGDPLPQDSTSRRCPTCARTASASSTARSSPT